MYFTLSLSIISVEERLNFYMFLLKICIYYVNNRLIVCFTLSLFIVDGLRILDDYFFVLPDGGNANTHNVAQGCHHYRVMALSLYYLT